MTVANSIKAALDEAEHVVRAQIARIAELEAEVAALKANADALQTLRNIYANPAEPTGHRIRAAQAALACETPRLEPVAPALELSAEPVEPLADVIARQRARQDRLQGRPIEIVPDPSSPQGQRVNLLAKPNGSSGDEQ